MSQIAAEPDLWEQLVDVEDPALPDVIEPLRKMKEEEARQSDAQLSVVLLSKDDAPLPGRQSTGLATSRCDDVVDPTRNDDSGNDTRGGTRYEHS